MADDNMTLGYLMGQESGGGGGGFGNFGEGIWAVIILAILFGRGGLGGLGGLGGFGGGGCEGGCATQADVRSAVDQQTLISKLDQQTYGLADSTYAINNAITGGFHGVDNAICNLGFNMQTAINGISREIGDCCCTTQRAIDGVNYNMATQFCALGNALQSSTRDIIDSQNSNTRAILDFLTQDKIATLTAENQSLKFAASQASQNAFITANQEAQTAELIRRLGRDCPVPAYVVPNPNCCYGGNYSGCGC
ncbi:MAG: hypothetical protein IKU94_00620 [Bacteroidaceae bacterium]|nr:hypothetical protein [Bacteroidaceae bacterium]MBR4930460.1 hypothetical protein [Bacteroidaceae bacterium]